MARRKSRRSKSVRPARQDSSCHDAPLRNPASLGYLKLEPRRVLSVNAALNGVNPEILET